MNTTLMNLIAVLFTVVFAVALLAQLERTHRRVQGLGHRRSPWEHVGPRAAGFGHELAGLRLDR
ncbi:MAG TPA: hypothetical protein PLU83_15355 [Phycicoccus sp.]|nr:hypothetical protein [Phycicoccus sp.]